MESFHKLQVNYSLKQVALVKKHKKTLSTLSISLLLSVIVSQALALPLTENKKIRQGQYSVLAVRCGLHNRLRG